MLERPRAVIPTVTAIDTSRSGSFVTPPPESNTRGRVTPQSTLRLRRIPSATNAYLSHVMVLYLEQRV